MVKVVDHDTKLFISAQAMISCSMYRSVHNVLEFSDHRSGCFQEKLIFTVSLWHFKYLHVTTYEININISAKPIITQNYYGILSILRRVKQLGRLCFRLTFHRWHLNLCKKPYRCFACWRLTLTAVALQLSQHQPQSAGRGGVSRYCEQDVFAITFFV